MWTVSASGHLGAGDSSIEGAIRELQEEIGIKANKNELEYLFTVKTQERPKNNFIDNEFADIYLINKNINISDLFLQKEEVSEAKFVHYKELEKMVKNSDKSLIELDEIYYKLFEILDKRFNN
jgi:isopentenyldiphosphate isomerase